MRSSDPSSTVPYVPPWLSVGVGTPSHRQSPVCYVSAPIRDTGRPPNLEEMFTVRTVSIHRTSYTSVVLASACPAIDTAEQEGFASRNIPQSDHYLCLHMII